MPPQTKQQNKRKKTSYKEASLEENNKKSAKKTKTQHNNNNAETRLENHVTMTRDVDPSQNASTTTNQNNNNQALPVDPQSENLNDIDLNDADLDTDNWTDIQYNTRHRIFIPTEKTTTQNRQEKRREIENLIPEYIRIVSSDTKWADNIMYIKIDFPTPKDKLAAMEELDKIGTQYKTSIKETNTASDNRKAEIVIRDIPLEINESDIRRHFSSYGSIAKINMKVNGAWQTANLTFNDESTVTEFFHEKWSDVVRKDSVRIYLAENYKQNKEERTRFCAKLCNIPKNTTGFDIEDYVHSKKGKTCFIPRTRVQYGRVRYAFINFENEADMQAAIDTEETQFMKNFIIYWTKADTKTCHICQSKEHLAANCPRLQDKVKNERKISKLATLYTKKRVETSGAKSVINKANSIQKGKKTYSQAAQEATSTSNNALNPALENRLVKIENLLNTALFAIEQIINKGIAEEERQELQDQIDARSANLLKTPSKAPKRNSTKPKYDQQINANQHRTTPSSLGASIHAPITDNSFTVAAEARILALETSIQKLTFLIQKVANQDEETPSTTMQS